MARETRVEHAKTLVQENPSEKGQACIKSSLDLSQDFSIRPNSGEGDRSKQSRGLLFIRLVCMVSAGLVSYCIHPDSSRY